MKKILLYSLLLIGSLGPISCGSKGSDPTPTPAPPVQQGSGFKTATGTFTIKPAQGAPYTVSNLSLKSELIELAATKELYPQYTYRGVSSDGKYAQIELYVTQASPLSGAGPWRQQATIYTTTNSYAQLTLVGYSYGTVSGLNGVYTATFSGAQVSGALAQ